MVTNDVLIDRLREFLAVLRPSEDVPLERVYLCLDYRMDDWFSWAKYLNGGRHIVALCESMLFFVSRKVMQPSFKRIPLSVFESVLTEERGKSWMRTNVRFIWHDSTDAETGNRREQFRAATKFGTSSCNRWAVWGLRGHTLRGKQWIERGISTLIKCNSSFFFVRHCYIQNKVSFTSSCNIVGTLWDWTSEQPMARILHGKTNVGGGAPQRFCDTSIVSCCSCGQ